MRILDGKPRFPSLGSGGGMRIETGLSNNIPAVGEDNPLIDKPKGIIDASDKSSEITEAMLEKASNYKFDTSDEAKKRRKEIAQKPWDEV